SKSANLGWGQRYHWLRYQHVPPGSRHEAHIVDTFALPPGLSTARLRSALNHLVRRHEVLRTVYRTQDGPWPRQVVQSPGPMAIREATTEQDGTPPPAEAIRAMTEADFDPATQWPARACVVTTAGVPVRLVMVFNHLAFDDRSLELLRAEFDALLRAAVSGRPARLMPVVSHPVDQALREESDEAREAARAALDHWRAELERMPADVFAGRRSLPADRGPALSASLTSPTLLAAARDAAARLRVWPSAIHLAAYAVSMASYTDEPVVTHRMYTSQREASGCQDLMTCMSYPTLVRAELGDDPAFTEVVRRAAVRVERAIAHAHVPYDEVAELVAHEGARRGRPVRVAGEFNFLSNAPRSCATRRDRLTWHAEPTEWTGAGSDTYFRVYEWSDGVTLALQAMAGVMDADAVERFLRGYALLLEAHREQGTDLRVSEAAQFFGFAPRPHLRMLRGATSTGLALDTHDPVAADQTEALIASHPAAVDARVESMDRGLVADVIVAEPVTPADLRAHVLGVIEEYPQARCPDWFRIRGALDAEGDGLDGLRRGAQTEAERALVGAVQEVNGLPDLDPADCYAATGARVLRIPRVIEALARQGWGGLRAGQLCGIRPLRSLAADLVRS
ncbi:MAG: condensation domain-containing protein, partial [Actinocrinis sp.]